MDGKHKYESISVLSLVPGVYKLDDGTIIQAGTVTVDGNKHFKEVPLSNSFTETPFVFTSVDSFKGPSAVTSRVKDVSKTSFKVALFEQESLLGTGHAPETVAYVAISAPNHMFNWNGKTYTLSTEEIDSNWKTLYSEGGKAFQMKLQEDQSYDGETYHTLETVDILMDSEGKNIFAQDVSTKGGNPVIIRIK